MEMEMDALLWGCIPDELLEHVLAMLPIKSLFRARTVCQRWESLLLSHEFLAMHAQNQAKEAWILMFSDPDYETLTSYVPKENKWFTLSLSFLPFKSLHPDDIHVKAAGGLLCFFMRQSCGKAHIIVCNPLTKSWKRLPHPHGKLDSVRSLVVDSMSKSYKVFAHSTYAKFENGCLCYSRMECYDSLLGKWAFPDDSTKLATCYYTCGLDGWPSTCSETISAFDTVHGVWIMVPMPKLRSRFFCSVAFPHLVECKGSPLMVSGFWGQNAGIYIWDLDLKEKGWQEVGRMPNSLLSYFLSPCTGAISFHCVGQEHNIYIINEKNPPSIVVFNFDLKTWDILSTCYQNIIHPRFTWFSFYPQLDMRA